MAVKYTFQVICVDPSILIHYLLVVLSRFHWKLVIVILITSCKMPWLYINNLIPVELEDWIITSIFSYFIIFHVTI